MRRTKSVLIVAGLFVVSLPQAAVAFGEQDTRVHALQSACGDVGDRTFGNCALRYVGARPADTYARQGDELIRVVVTHPVRIVGALIVVEVVLPKSGDATVTVRDPYMRVPSQTYRVTRERFASLRQHLLEADHLMASVEIGRKEDTKRGCAIETVCLDPAVGFVDVVLSGEALHIYLDACGDFFQIVQDIVDFAVKADPTCSDNISDTWGTLVLQACLNVRGDRRLAAEGLGAATAMSNALDGSEKARDSVKGKIGDGARLLVGDAPVAAGPSGILTWWSQVAARGYVWFVPADATGADNRIVVTGTIGQTVDATDASAMTFSARFVQTWEKDRKGKVRLVAWRIGEFRAQ